MIDNGKQYLEDNASRLIHVGLGLSPRPDPQMKEQTWQRLLGQLDAEQTNVGFPDGALVVLACTLAWMAVWIAKRMLSVGLAATVIPSLELIYVVLALNLLCVPVAGIVIILTRRRYV